MDGPGERPKLNGGGATEPMSSQNGINSIMKTVFTTGEAAKICKVSQQTIIRCFDSGQLKGFRVPGSRFRRIPREALCAHRYPASSIASACSSASGGP